MSSSVAHNARASVIDGIRAEMAASIAAKEAMLDDIRLLDQLRRLTAACTASLRGGGRGGKPMRDPGRRVDQRERRQAQRDLRVLPDSFDGYRARAGVSHAPRPHSVWLGRARFVRQRRLAWIGGRKNHASFSSSR